MLQTSKIPAYCVFKLGFEPIYLALAPIVNPLDFWTTIGAITLTTADSRIFKSPQCRISSSIRSTVKYFPLLPTILDPGTILVVLTGVMFILIFCSFYSYRGEKCPPSLLVFSVIYGVSRFSLHTLHSPYS